MSREIATKLGILRTQLKQKLISDGLLSEDSQLILDDDTHFQFEYRIDNWYAGTIDYVISYYTTRSNITLVGYQLMDYQI